MEYFESLFCDLSKAFDCLRQSFAVETTTVDAVLPGGTLPDSLDGRDVVGGSNIGIPQGSIFETMIFNFYK